MISASGGGRKGSSNMSDIIADPHGLLACGEPLATAIELADRFGLSRTRARAFLGGFYARIRYVDRRPARLYSIADFERLLPEARAAWERRREHGLARERAQQEAAAARRAAKSAPKARAKTTPTPAPPPLATFPRRPVADAPEILVIRRRAPPPIVRLPQKAVAKRRTGEDEGGNAE
jgi:hypothetical protein